MFPLRQPIKQYRLADPWQRAVRHRRAGSHQVSPPRCCPTTAMQTSLSLPGLRTRCPAWTLAVASTWILGHQGKTELSKNDVRHTYCDNSRHLRLLQAFSRRLLVCRSRLKWLLSCILLHRWGGESSEYNAYGEQNSLIQPLTDGMLEDCPESNNSAALSFTELLNQATSI